jgi:hypothetical protein
MVLCLVLIALMRHIPLVLSPIPTVSLDVIYLVASSYGYYKGQIEQPAAQ